MLTQAFSLRPERIFSPVRGTCRGKRNEKRGEEEKAENRERAEGFGGKTATRKNKNFKSNFPRHI